MALHSVIWLSAVVPQHQNPNAALGFPKEQVLRKGGKVRAPEHARTHMETAGILFDPAHECLELQVEAFGKRWADLLSIVGQNVSKIALDEAMKRQAHDYDLRIERRNCSNVIARLGSRSSSASRRSASVMPSSLSESTAGNESSNRAAKPARAASGSFIASNSISLGVCMAQM
jgi:hypothetical protein